MGRQIQFYMTEEDEDEFVAYLHSLSDVSILPQTSDKQPCEEFTSFRSLNGRRLGDDSVIWNKSISPKPSFEYYSAHGGCYCVDFLESEVVNVVRSKRTDQRLTMGRIHIDDKTRRSDGTLADKSKEFLNWFSELSGWFRKNYRSTVNGAYLSIRAANLAKNGVELTGQGF